MKLHGNLKEYTHLHAQISTGIHFVPNSMKYLDVELSQILQDKSGKSGNYEFLTSTRKFTKDYSTFNQNKLCKQVVSTVLYDCSLSILPTLIYKIPVLLLITLIDAALYESSFSFHHR
jgi:hypothetical protein